MGSSPLRLDSPPPQPPEVTAQTGQSPYGGISQMMAQKAAQQKQGGGPPGDLASGVHPQGALLAQFQAVKKVLEQMSKLSEGFAPFAKRAIDILQTGVGSVVSGGAPGQNPETAPQISGPAEQSNRPPEGDAGKSFPG